MPELRDDERMWSDMVDDADQEKTPAGEIKDLKARVAALEDRIGALETKGIADA